MEKIIRKILNEIKFSQERAEELKNKFGWRFVQSQNPRGGKLYKKRHVYTFKSPKYKYLAYIEEYEYDFYLISFFPKLNKDFYVKQFRLSSVGADHYDEYSYLTKENIPLQILTLLMSEMKTIISNKPFSSFGYFGAADFKTGSEDDLFNTKRVRIYNKIISDELSNTHKIISDPTFSGSLVLNQDVLKEYPLYENYCMDILQTHL
jgi:hypothetical protein